VAYVVVLLAVAHAVMVRGTADSLRARRTAALVAALAIGQAALGIWTLLAWVPTGLGVAHQAGALALAAAAVAHLHAIRRAPPARGPV
jgi:cytochrome c oxidase assembly protein subunit 15